MTRETAIQTTTVPGALDRDFTGYNPLFDRIGAGRWRMSGPGRFVQEGNALVAEPAEDMGLFWCIDPTPENFILRVEWRLSGEDDNSGVFVRFPNPDEEAGYENPARSAVDLGFEIQIDERGRPDGDPLHRTGAIYECGGQELSLRAAMMEEWNLFEIRVQDQVYEVYLNGQGVSRYANPHRERGRIEPAFVGLQAHAGSVRFRNIFIKKI